MTGVSIDSVEDPLPDVRDESGTAPGDRRFRPDVEGLRAVAIVLVVLYHGSLQALSGGYVGVDVFFVISGFVITGSPAQRALVQSPHVVFEFLRSAQSPHHSGGHLGHRCDRHRDLCRPWVPLYGNPTAVDARWTAVFLANFHFTATGTNYLTAQEPPSPLLNFWSLAVEEQFYLVYPAFFAVVAVTFTKDLVQDQARLGVVRGDPRLARASRPLKRTRVRSLRTSRRWREPGSSRSERWSPWQLRGS